MNFRLEAALPQPMVSLPRMSLPLPPSALDERDLLDQLNLADRADWTLLGLVSCTAIATLLLAAVISLLH
jgi:hypothetical protein